MRPGVAIACILCVAFTRAVAIPATPLDETEARNAAAYRYMLR